MRASVDFSQAKFFTGQVVKRQNQTNKFCMYLMIEARLIKANVLLLDSAPDVMARSYYDGIGTIEFQEDVYICTVQGGIYDKPDATENDLMRPGLSLRPDRTELEAIAEVEPWTGKIALPDTAENLTQRLEIWDTYLAARKK